MSEKYDVIAVGMGPSSIFMAYELIKLKKAHKVLLIEQGKKVEDRYCPIEKTGNCLYETWLINTDTADCFQHISPRIRKRRTREPAALQIPEPAVWCRAQLKCSWFRRARSPPARLPRAWRLRPRRAGSPS